MILFRTTLYHGSPFRFKTFSASPSGIHLGTYDQAAHAATLKLARLPLKVFKGLEEVNGRKGKIYVCEFSLGTTKRIDDPRTPQAWGKHIKKAQSEGYTSIVYLNEYEGTKPADSYCIFEPSQVFRLSFEAGNSELLLNRSSNIIR